MAAMNMMAAAENWDNDVDFSAVMDLIESFEKADNKPTAVEQNEPIVGISNLKEQCEKFVIDNEKENTKCQTNLSVRKVVSYLEKRGELRRIEEVLYMFI